MPTAVRDLCPSDPSPAHLGLFVHPRHLEMKFQIESTHSFLPTGSFPFDREAKSLGFGVRRSSVESLRSAASWLWSLSPCKLSLPVSGMGYRSPAYTVVRKSNRMTDTDGKTLRFSQVPPSLTLIVEAKTV